MHTIKKNYQKVLITQNQRDHALTDVNIVLKDVEGCYTIIGQEDLYVSLYVIHILYMV